MALRYWPVPKGTVVTSGFKSPHRPTHFGIDLDWNLADDRMPIYAAQAGTVIQVGAASGYGGPDPHGWIRIDHSTAQGGGETVYGHITRLSNIRVGTPVTAGQHIGYTNGNRATNGGVAAHLHFEVHPWSFSPGAQINPVTWLDGALWPGDEPGQSGFDAQALGDVMGWSLSKARYEQLLPAYLKMLDIVGAKSINQFAMIAAQLGHESVGLKYQEEIASGAAYEWRSDLGNIYAGDGVKFKGHGWIQVTGRANHTAVSKWAHQRGLVPTPTFFVDNPKLLGADAYCWIGPAWYLTTARPGWMAAAARGDLETCTRMINGGLNGLADRRSRYQRALNLGARLLPSKEVNEVEKVLPYPRDQVKQDTVYNCGPASVQTIVRAATKTLHSESVLGGKLGTTVNGTNWIGQFPKVLNQYMPAAQYVHVEMSNDPPDTTQKNKLWADIKNSIDAGYGVVANIVAPPNNYPKAVPPSTISPSYRGGTVYHYIAIMGYGEDIGGKRYWVADSGFYPYGYWIGHEQLASLIPPKGYAYATAKPRNEVKGDLMALSDKEQRELLSKVREIHHELTHRFQSRYPGSEYRDTMIGYVLEQDRKIEDMHANMLPAIWQKFVSNFKGGK